ncbi:MAG: hypothetical protein V4658_11555 [Bacteroidota bacterium]
MTTTTKLMRETPSWLFIPLLLISFFSLSYCTEKQQNKSENAVEEFKGYVNQQVSKADDAGEEKWEDVEKAYAEKKAKADAEAEKLEAGAKESYTKAVKDWEQYKEKAAARQEIKQAEKDARLLRASLMPAGINADLKNITGANIASVYEHFIEEVEKNKETYSKEQWININNYWQSLNDVKDKLDETKSISKKDNKTIRGIKAKYSATKALNKPFAESEKNMN